MASKRQERRKSCEGKIKFNSQKDAESASVSYGKTYHVWMTAYHCKFCRKFHIGHPPRRVKQAIIREQATRRYDD
jgi:hypothetical protein